MKKYGIYTPKEENEEVLGIEVLYSRGDYEEDNYVSGVIFVPDTYKDTVALFKELGLSNLKSYFFSSLGGAYIIDPDDKKYESNEVIYFTVPDDWNRDEKVQCIPCEGDMLLCNLEVEAKNPVTECVQISDRVWAYTMPDIKEMSKKYDGDFSFEVDRVMFYQIDKDNTRITGAIPLPQKYNGQMLTLGKQTLTDYHMYASPMYEFQWKKFEMK